MATREKVFHCCKSGDLTDLQYLVETEEVDVNIRDAWDSTPLYYACLCGHIGIVEFLIKNGAKCEANSFDGERCLYGALTNEIRNVLKSWKQIHPTQIRRDKHFELLRHMLEGNGFESDIVFQVHNTTFHAHRCILASRSPYFEKALASKWRYKDVIPIRRRQVSPEAFSSLLQYLYLGRVDVKLDLVEDLKTLAEHIRIPHLVAEIENLQQRVKNFVSLKPSIGHKVEIFTVESQSSFQTLTMDLRNLVELTLPPMLRDWVDEGVLPFWDPYAMPLHYPDLCIVVEGCRFLCHKVFVCGISDYFKALLMNHFNESHITTSGNMPVITLREMRAVIFKHILIYIYAGVCEFKSIDYACEILPIADMMLLNGLKRLCGNVLAQHLSDQNMVSMYRYAQTFNLSGLEEECKSYMAAELEKLVDAEDFAELVKEDAFSVHNREKTDSIPIVDDIRYIITHNVRTYSQMEEAAYKLAKLDALLSRLGIEC